MKNIVSILFLFLCIGALFTNINAFIDKLILPKWLFTLLGMSIVGNILVYSIIFKKNWTYNIQALYIIIIGVCVFQAAYGLLQFCDLLYSNSALYKVVGSFDNPAGFAGCLCAGIPFCLYFSRIPYNKKIRWISWGILVFLYIAVFLSYSRAGIISMTIISIVFLLRQNAFLQNFKLRILTTSVIVLLIGSYFLKKDSANGRLLIWKCTWEMFKDKPLFGHGLGAFEAHYMDYQARYFAEHPESKYSVLADNAKHVFNEYLSLGMQFGMTGWLILCTLMIFLRHCYQKAPSPESNVACLSLLSIGIFACFSYPFTYPFVWIITLLDVFLLIHSAYPYSVFIHRRTVLLPLGMIIFICSLLLLYKVCLRTYTELEWGKIVRKSLQGQTLEMLPYYQKLVPQLGNNPYFLYNYAVEFYVAGHYNTSLNVAKRCRKYWANYDLELLQAEALYNIGKQAEAEQHYILASQMCPVRFIPLYRLYEIYKKQKKTEEASRLGLQILHKPVKIDSPIIQTIQQQIRMDNKHK